MNDADTLKQHNIKDGLTVHLVIKTPPRPEPEGGPRRPPGTHSTLGTSITVKTLRLLFQLKSEYHLIDKLNAFQLMIHQFRSAFVIKGVRSAMVRKGVVLTFCIV